MLSTSVSLLNYSFQPVCTHMLDLASAGSILFNAVSNLKILTFFLTKVTNLGYNVNLQLAIAKFTQ